MAWTGTAAKNNKTGKNFNANKKAPYGAFFVEA
jgi:hypothetical protein